MDPLLMLRRDFADELGFGVFLDARVPVVSEERVRRNAALFLSPNSPRFLGYVVQDGIGSISADGRVSLEVRTDGLFGEMIAKATDAIRRSPVAHAASCAGAAPTPLSLLHDLETQAVWLMSFEALRVFLRNQAREEALR